MQTMKTTKDVQTKVGETLTVFYDAQLAMQKNAVATLGNAFEGSLALQRSALRAWTRAFEVPQSVVQPTAEQVAAQFRAYVAAVPGFTPEAAEKMAHEVAQTYVMTRDATGKQVAAVREASMKAVAQYEQFLGQVEVQSVEGLKAATQSVETATKTAAQVTSEWVDAVFDAVNAAVKAAEDAQVAVTNAVTPAVAPKTPPATGAPGKTN